MPDALIPVVTLIAIVAIARGDVSSRDVIRIGKSILVISAIGLTILYVHTWLYETVLNRDAPAWLTIVSTIPVLILAFTTHVILTVLPPTRPNQHDTTHHQ